LLGFFAKTDDQKGISQKIMFLIDSSHDLAAPKLELIAEKISQPSGMPRISRPRLLNLLQESMTAGTSTLISSRAGTGKTTLALDFARQCGRFVAWYKIDAPDADPVVFFRYLMKSIQESRPGFGSKSLASLTDFSDLESLNWLANAFVYELAEGENANPLLIVIEDLHLVSDSDWLVTFFSRVLPLLPSEVHILITSRNLPSAPMWRMRSKQKLVVIDEATLAFTRPEATQLFASYGLSPDQASIAVDHTHGRAAALTVSAEFLQRSAVKSAPAVQLPNSALNQS
jgi:LuxR family maltose regulon positive regulatory protein